MIKDEDLLSLMKELNKSEVYISLNLRILDY